MSFETADKEIKSGVGVRLRSARLVAGLTQTNLGAKSGYANETVSNIERGGETPSLRFLLSVSDVLDICPIWLRTGQGEMVSFDTNAARMEARATALLRSLETQAASSSLADSESPLFQAISQLRAGMEQLDLYRALMKKRAKKKRTLNQPVTA